VLKAVSQHASLGLDDDCVVAPADEADLRRRLAGQAERLGCRCFAEDYIDGRELNLSLLGGTGQPLVLPPAEIDFSRFPPGKPRIVG
jgi:D-alanine-D-alanine ligase